MKKIKNVVAVMMTAVMLFSMTGCHKNIKEISKKDFKNALEDELDVDSDDISDWSDDDEKCYIYISDDYVQSYIFIEFDDEDDAADAFEDYYDDFEDVKDDDDFDGSSSAYISDSTGYILFDGETDDDKFLEESEIYGGIYHRGAVLVVAYSADGGKSDNKDIDTFLSAVGYPKP